MLLGERAAQLQQHREHDEQQEFLRQTQEFILAELHKQYDKQEELQRSSTRQTGNSRSCRRASSGKMPCRAPDSRS